jgi:hypothetical protein
MTLYENYSQTAYDYDGVTGTTKRLAQQFKIGSVGANVKQTLTSIELRLFKNGSPDGTLTIQVFLADGAHKPTGTALCTATASASAVTNGLNTFATWDTYPNFEASTEYCIVISESATVNTSNCIYWGWNGTVNGDAGADYANGGVWGSADSGATWGATIIGAWNFTDIDFVFKVNGTLFVAPVSGFSIVGDLVF